MGCCVSCCRRPLSVEEAESQIHSAVINNHIGCLQYMLDLGVDINTGNLLHTAVRHECTSIVFYLLRRGADANGKNEFGHTSLHLALTNGQAEVAAQLCSYGGWNEEENKSHPYLHTAIINGHLDCVVVLMKVGKVNLECPDALGYTPLHNAILTGRFEIVAYLIGRGANLRAVDSVDRTCLQLAQEYNRRSILQFLLAHEYCNNDSI